MKNKSLWLIFLLILISFSTYAFNLNNPLFWDDDEWIKGNVFVHSFSFLKEIFTQNVEAGFGLNSNYYRPLLLLSFAVNYVIQGVWPFGYHLLSNGIHITNGILVFILLSSFIGSRASFIASLLFLIHPAQTEAVAYISGRGDPMSVFFMLLALLLFVKYTRQDSDFYDMSRKWEFFGSIFFFILAILSRETAILFPLFLMIFYVSFLNRDANDAKKHANYAKKDLQHSHKIRILASLKLTFIKTIPYWIISAVYFILRLTVFNFQNTLNFYSQPTLYSENLSFRIFTFGSALVEYFKILFVPVGLHMERSLPVNTSFFQWPVWVGVLVVLIIIWVGVVLYRKEKMMQIYKSNANLQIANKNIIRDSHHSHEIRILASRIWFFSWSWFFIALIPVSGIIPINAIIYEHWLYLPLIGLAALAGFYIDKVFTLLSNANNANKHANVANIHSYHSNGIRRLASRILVVLLVIYFSFFAVQSIRRNILWGKPIKFYEDILKYSPSSVRIITNLGNLYSEKGDLARAEDLFKRAIENPEGDIFAQPHYNLGNIYRDSGRIDEAIEEYKKAIEIDPNFPFAYQNLAEVYVNRKKDLIPGIKILEELKKIQPGNPRVYYNLGLVYLATNNNDLAIKNFEFGFNLARGRDEEVEQAISEILNQVK